jgi:acyl-CoA hydrolase
MTKPVVAVGEGTGSSAADPVAVGRAHDVTDAQVVLGLFYDAPPWIAEPLPWPARTYMPAYGLGPAARAGAVDYLPASLGAMPAVLAGPLRAELAVVPAVRRGEGWAHLETVGMNDTIARHAERVLVQEVDDADDVGAPAFEGNVVGVIGGGRRPSPREARPPNAAELRIAELAAALVPDGATVQYGIGTGPEAVVAAITRPVSILSGLVTDAVVALHERGCVAGDVLTSYVWGSSTLLDLVRSGRVTTMGVKDLFARDAGSMDRFVAINTALQVGLDGAVNIERVGDRQVAGLGGHPDWCKAATHSPGGLSIVVAPSTYRGRSTIVASPDVVSTPRGDVGIVVTEHGVADLRARTAPERRKALLAIAAPEHRAALERAGN